METIDRPFATPISASATVSYHDVEGTIAADNLDSPLVFALAELVGVDTDAWWPVHFNCSIGHAIDRSRISVGVTVYAVERLASDESLDDVRARLAGNHTAVVTSFCKELESVEALLNMCKDVSLHFSPRGFSFDKLDVQTQHNL